jgi:hypothetical protein
LLSGVKYRNNIKEDSYKIGCFGELRQMKNHLMQAFAVANFANYVFAKSNKPVEFHINTSYDNDPVLKSIRQLVKHINSKEVPISLVEHFWMEGEDFDKVIRTMNLGMQISFSETFNLTAAKFIRNGVFVIGSQTIPWVLDELKCPAHDATQILTKLKKIYSIQNSLTHSIVFEHQKRVLTKQVSKSEFFWERNLNLLRL